MCLPLATRAASQEYWRMLQGAMVEQLASQAAAPEEVDEEANALLSLARPRQSTILTPADAFDVKASDARKRESLENADAEKGRRRAPLRALQGGGYKDPKKVVRFLGAPLGYKRDE